MKRVLAAAAILAGLSGAASAQMTPTDAYQAMEYFQHSVATQLARVLQEDEIAKEMCKPYQPCGLPEISLCSQMPRDRKFGCEERIEAKRAELAAERRAEVAAKAQADAAKAAADAKRFNSEWCDASATCMRERAAAAQK